MPRRDLLTAEGDWSGAAVTVWASGRRMEPPPPGAPDEPMSAADCEACGGAGSQPAPRGVRACPDC